MKEPTFDQHGYPTEETLKAINEWDFRDLHGLFEYIEAAWEYSDTAWEWIDERTIECSTCGWSGNESLISALCDNTLAWALSWHSSRRGGHYRFEFIPLKEESDSERAVPPA